MAKASPITAELARQLLRYEPEAGKLFWVQRSREMFANQNAFTMWNTRYAMKEAFTTVDGRGYRVGAIFDRLYRAHRVMSLIVTGEWPTDQIDHINGVRVDNRWINLRAVSNTENQRNQFRRTDNTSGVCGVHWRKDCQKWSADIKVDGRNKHLGCFNTIEEAAAIRAAASSVYGFSERHGHGTSG